MINCDTVYENGRAIVLFRTLSLSDSKTNTSLSAGLLTINPSGTKLDLSKP